MAATTPRASENPEDTQGGEEGDTEETEAGGEGDPPGSGCMDDNASNFDANATEDDGSCLYPVIFTLDTTCSGLDTSKGVFVNGTMNEWCGDCWPMEESGDGVFTTTKDLPLGEVEYKFTIGEEWEALPECGDCVLVFNDGEYINRVTTVVASVNVLDTVAFGTCVACGETPCCTAAADCPASSGNPARRTRARKEPACLSPQMKGNVHTRGGVQERSVQGGDLPAH